MSKRDMQEQIRTTGIIPKGEYFIVSIPLKDGCRGTRTTGQYLALQDVNIGAHLKELKVDTITDPVLIHIARSKLFLKLEKDGLIERLEFAVNIEFEFNEANCTTQEDIGDVSYLPCYDNSQTLYVDKK